MTPPTPEDMAVDLPTCLGYIQRYGMADNGIGAPWSSAIRRAIFAEAEVERLNSAIRKHRDQRADDRCVGDDYELYTALGESIPQHACQLNAPEIMLSDCQRFIASRHDPEKPYLSPQREIERLQGIIEGLAARVAAQSELLSRRAES